MKIKLIATDLDGTLFNSKGLIPRENVEALKAAMEKGVVVVPCSGRCQVNIRHMEDALGIKTPLIALNGSLIQLPDRKEDVFCRFMDREGVLRLMDIITSQGDFFYNLCTPEQRYVISTEPFIDQALRIRKILGEAGVLITDIDDFSQIADEDTSRCLKIIASSPNRENVAALRKRAEDAALPLTITSSWWNNIEAVAQGVDKGAGIIRLCNYLGIDPGEVMVLGDEDNDLSMFQVAGWPVAMGNASDSVKACAKAITGTNDEAGVAQAIRRYVLGEA